MDLKEITAKIDDLATDIQEFDPVVAYALDRVSDELERLAAAPHAVEDTAKIIKKFIEDQLRKLTPEQRKELEEIMVQYETGKFVRMERRDDD